MKYNLENPADRENLSYRVQHELAKATGFCEFKVLKPCRTLSQNNYLHVILAYFASQIGETTDYVKDIFFKQFCNGDIFLRTKHDSMLGNVQFLRSSSSLTTEEMSLAISRFRNFSSMNAGIYIPSSDEHKLLEMAQIEIERNKEFIQCPTT